MQVRSVPDDRQLLRGILARDIRRDLLRHLRPMLAWHLLFTAFATVAAAPLTTAYCRPFGVLSASISPSR